MCQHLSFTAFGKACGGKAKVRTESGKPRRSGSQGGLRKRGLWKRLNGHVKRKRRNRPSLCLRLRAPYFYPDQRLNLSKPWEGLRRICQGFKPYSGNPTVRHYRGASGDVRDGETVTPSRNRKSGNGNPSPTAGRARFLSRQKSACFRFLRSVIGWCRVHLSSSWSRSLRLTSNRDRLGTAPRRQLMKQLIA